MKKTFTIQIPSDTKYPLTSSLLQTLIVADSISLIPADVMVTQVTGPYVCSGCGSPDPEIHAGDCPNED